MAKLKFLLTSQGSGKICIRRWQILPVLRQRLLDFRQMLPPTRSESRMNIDDRRSGYSMKDTMKEESMNRVLSLLTFTSTPLKLSRDRRRNLVLCLADGNWRGSRFV
jgi:hypothetical protein